MRTTVVDPKAPVQVAPPSASWISANLSPRKNLRYDVPAGLVVFLVALPLCLGIALASGAPLMAGLITGIIGGVVVSWLTGSALSVSGPAAGLTVIVLDGIHGVGFAAFLVAVLLAGALQFVLGLVRAGVVAYYFPSTVIKGMLAAIGIILILKQIPHAIGWDPDYEGDFFFFQPDGRNTLTEIPVALEHIQWGACIIAFVGLALLVALARLPPSRVPKWMPGPLAAVLAGVVLNEVFRAIGSPFANEAELLVQIPALRWQSIDELLHFPDFSAIGNVAVLKLAVVLGIVGSIETLLCIEAADRIDPFRRRSDADRELRAQGVGNMLCGLIGGIPMTAVIVRTSANVQSGGRTPMASFVHGLLLLVSVVALSGLLNRIPLAALAAVLLHVGYKLAPWQLFRRMAKLGTDQFLPFVITVVAIVFTDLLTGVAIGMAVGLFFILRANAKTPFFMNLREDSGGVRRRVRIRLSENVTFLNKASFSKILHEVPDGSRIVIDASEARWIDRDVLEMIHEFDASAHHRGVEVELVDVPPVDAPPGDLEERKPIVTTAAEVRRADVVPRR